MDAPDFFAAHAVFTHDAFAAFMGREGDRSRRTTDSVLAYHVKTGHLLRIRRGLYASVPGGQSPESVVVDPFLIAGMLAPDATLAYHTALEFHGKAYSVHHQFVYLTRTASRPLEFRGSTFLAVAPPRALGAGRRANSGVQPSDRAGLPIRVTTLERTMVDVLDRPELAGGWEEVWRSLELVEFFDLDLVITYTLLLKNATLAAKVGFYLEQHREALMVTEPVLRRLRRHRPRQPRYADRAAKGASRLVAAWNLLVPESLVTRSFAEVP